MPWESTGELGSTHFRDGRGPFVYDPSHDRMDAYSPIRNFTLALGVSGGYCSAKQYRHGRY